jgi:hypothetical protein
MRGTSRGRIVMLFELSSSPLRRHVPKAIPSPFGGGHSKRLNMMARSLRKPWKSLYRHTGLLTTRAIMSQERTSRGASRRLECVACDERYDADRKETRATSPETGSRRGEAVVRPRECLTRRHGSESSFAGAIQSSKVSSRVGRSAALLLLPCANRG